MRRVVGQLRACEVAALGIQDRVFLGGPYTDEDYRARRRSALVIAVNCTTAASTCTWPAQVE